MTPCFSKSPSIGNRNVGVFLGNSKRMTGLHPVLGPVHEGLGLQGSSPVLGPGFGEETPKDSCWAPVPSWEKAPTLGQLQAWSRAVLGQHMSHQGSTWFFHLSKGHPLERKGTNNSIINYLHESSQRFRQNNIAESHESVLGVNMSQLLPF